MKKKFYFIIGGIIQIIASGYAIMKAEVIKEELLSVLSMLPEILQERVINLYQNSGVAYIRALAIICILLNIVVIYMAWTDKVFKKKGLMIALSVLMIFTANYSIIELIAIINIVILAGSHDEENNTMKIKKEIPKLEKEKVSKRDFLLAVGLMVVYFSQRLWGKFIPENSIGSFIKIGFYVLMMGLCIWVFRDKLKHDFKYFKDNFGVYIEYILARMGIFYLIFIVVSLICILSVKATAANQDLIEQLPILLSLPLAVIYAPLVEEVLFRGCIRRFIRNDKIFILVSGIIFGLLHTVFSEHTILNTIILAIPYGFMGSFLAYIYVKTNNMWSNMFCHALNNAVAMILLILMTRL